MKKQDSRSKLDQSHAAPEVAEFISAYFEAKSGRDLEGVTNSFSPDAVTYSDAPMGWAADGYEMIRGGFAMRMEQPEDGLSYPLTVLGGAEDGDGGVVVAFTNTPGIVGDELHILAAIDIRGGRIVRQVDYWDSRGFDDQIYDTQRTPADKFPREYKEDAIGTSASSGIVEVASSLQDAIAKGDAAGAAALFDYDGVWEDRSLRTQVIGRSAIESYLRRTLETSPLGAGSRLRHVVGNDLGGGFEWHASPQFGATDGITALVLDSDLQIVRATSVYDSRQIDPDELSSLILLATAA